MGQVRTKKQGLRFLVLLGACAVATPAVPGPCATDHVDEDARVAYVYDGDTVKLSDGRKLRLIGIDTPEIGHDDRPPQPYAQEARQALTNLLGPNPRIGLRYDVERRDRHGRGLAHAFLPDGTNVQQRLLQKGLATAFVVPPNLWRHECYAAVEAQARDQRAGIWRLTRYQVLEADELPRGARGFRIITGRVQRVGESTGTVWLNLTPRVALRILKDDLGYFQAFSPRALRGRRVEARGWLQSRRGALRMRIRHPAALSVLD